MLATAASIRHTPSVVETAPCEWWLHRLMCSISGIIARGIVPEAEQETAFPRAPPFLLLTACPRGLNLEIPHVDLGTQYFIARHSHSKSRCDAAIRVYIALRAFHCSHVAVTMTLLLYLCFDVPLLTHSCATSSRPPVGFSSPSRKARQILARLSPGDAGRWRMVRVFPPSLRDRDACEWPIVSVFLGPFCTLLLPAVSIQGSEEVSIPHCLAAEAHAVSARRSHDTEYSKSDLPKKEDSPQSRRVCNLDRPF